VTSSRARRDTLNGQGEAKSPPKPAKPERASRFNLVELFGNPRVIPCAIVPLLAPIFVPATGGTVSWNAAATPLIAIGVLVVVQLARQYLGDKPAKIWRGTPRATFVLDVGMVITAALGLFYALQPWAEAFTVSQILALNGGFAVAGSAFQLLVGPIWVARMKQNSGPFKKFKGPGFAWFAVILYAILIAPMVGYLASLPLSFLYLEEVASGGPSGWTREGWLLFLTLIVAVPAATLWAYLELRRRLTKLGR